MKIERLQTILGKLAEQFPDADIKFGDGYIFVDLFEEPTQEQVDAIPMAEYEEYKSVNYAYRILRIWSN